MTRITLETLRDGKLNKESNRQKSVVEVAHLFYTALYWRMYTQWYDRPEYERHYQGTQSARVSAGCGGLIAGACTDPCWWFRGGVRGMSIDVGNGGI